MDKENFENYFDLLVVQWMKYMLRELNQEAEILEKMYLFFDGQIEILEKKYSTGKKRKKSKKKKSQD